MAKPHDKDGGFSKSFTGNLSEHSVQKLRQLHESRSEDFTTALKILADGTRCEDRREAYGKTGMLDYLLELQATTLVVEVRSECLRAIANSCADTDTNRDRVISSPYFGAVLGHLTDKITIHVALAALYNVSLDYDPAQRALRENGLFLILVNLFEDPNLDHRLVNGNGHSLMLQHITGLLGFAVEDYDVNSSPDTVLLTLFKYMLDGAPGLEEVFPLLSAVGLHLKYDRFKTLLFEQGLFELYLVSILRCFGYTGSSRASLSEIISPDILPDDIEDLESGQTALIANLRDLTSSPAFFEKYPFESADTGTWFTWLHSESADLQLLSCCILSNYARAREDWAEDIITTYNVQMRLICLCVQKPESRVALATLEILLQLARPHSNRARICGHDFLERLSSIWETDATRSSGLIRTQYASIAVLLGLVTDCAPAVQRLVGHSAPGSPEIPVSYLESLLRFYVLSNDRKVRIEIAKVVMEIGKIVARLGQTQLGSGPSADAILLSCLSIQPAFVTPISMVISQTEDPILQAQGYFTLVIIARQQLGVTMVKDVMRQHRVFKHLVQAVTKQSAVYAEITQSEPEKVDPARFAAIQRSVHENAVCLVQEIIDRKDPQLSCDWLELLSDLSRCRIEDVARLMSQAMPLLIEDNNIS
ncbi:hypothetical protein G7Y79_00041g077810 [Physcia stellaris]|nr:hypothetical protein G7Y79_00041g077810 [Physcia stellaris]